MFWLNVLPFIEIKFTYFVISHYHLFVFRLECLFLNFGGLKYIDKSSSSIKTQDKSSSIPAIDSP